MTNIDGKNQNNFNIFKNSNGNPIALDEIMAALEDASVSSLSNASAQEDKPPMTVSSVEMGVKHSIG